MRLISKFDKIGKGPVVYWISRDQRIKDNPALSFAQRQAVLLRRPLLVIFTLSESFLDATLRQYDFMIRGLQELEKNLLQKNISFYLLIGEPIKTMPSFLKSIDAGMLIIDFDPLSIKRRWKTKVIDQLKIAAYEVDGRNVIPCWLASPKQEFSAYTLRKKIGFRLHDHLIDYPNVKKHPYKLNDSRHSIDWTTATESLKVDKNVLPVSWLKPGEKAAFELLEDFIKKKLKDYSKNRNDPTKDAQSNLSPYLHFGQISSSRVIKEVLKCNLSSSIKNDFVEEIFIRRDLADNFCYYNNKYDSFESLHDWAKKTLNEHRSDKRVYCYVQSEFEAAKTHDPIWNAAQKEMVKRGKMHGYMRMYWAKKILEWSKSPEKAIRIAIHLNDKYELDGRDPNGYAGIMWSIGGLHDRAWGERQIFGKIRYMSSNGLKSKFDIDKYVQSIEAL